MVTVTVHEEGGGRAPTGAAGVVKSPRELQPEPVSTSGPKGATNVPMATIE